MFAPFPARIPAAGIPPLHGKPCKIRENSHIYCIMGCYYTLYLNTYGYSLLFYKVYHEEGECRQLEFWLEKEQTLETYSALLQKS